MYELRLGVQEVYKHYEVHVFTYSKSHKMNRIQAKAAFLHNVSTLFKNSSTTLADTLTGFQCPEDEDSYVGDIKVTEGIQLDRDAIRPNTAK